MGTLHHNLSAAADQPANHVDRRHQVAGLTDTCQSSTQETGHHLVAGKGKEGSSTKVAEVLHALLPNENSSSFQGWKLCTAGFLKPGLRGDKRVSLSLGKKCSRKRRKPA